MLTAKFREETIVITRHQIVVGTPINLTDWNKVVAVALQRWEAEGNNREEDFADDIFNIEVGDDEITIWWEVEEEK